MHVAKLKRAWNLASVLQIFQKISEHYCPGLHLSNNQVWLLNELWFKRMHPISCTNIYHDVADLVNQAMIENIKTCHLENET